MSILNIRKAERAGAKAVIGISGQSGSGKTLTALYIARGMVDKPEEIGFLDTENRRGSLYSDELDGPFMIGDLFYPFSPARYAQAIKEFQDAGVKILVIDSVSHEWDQGCMEIAETGEKMADWNGAKSEHKKFMNVLLQSDMHAICCIRAAEKMDFSNPRKPVSIGVQPICEKNFMFEMTVSVMLFDEGTRREHTKVPKDLRDVFGHDRFGEGYLGIETGRKIREWIEKGNVDPVLESWRNKMQLASTGGTDGLAKAWKSMPEDMQKELAKFKRMFWESAKCVDDLSARERKSRESDNEERVQSSSPKKQEAKPTKAFNPALPEEKKSEPEPATEPDVDITEDDLDKKF